MTPIVKEQFSNYFLRIGKFLLSILLLLICAIIPLPVEGVSVSYFRICLVVGVSLILIAPQLIRAFHPNPNKNILTATRYGACLIPCLFIVLLFVPSVPLFIVLPLLLALGFSFVFFSSYEQLLPESGILSLLFFIGALTSTEVLLDAINNKQLHSEVSTTPPLLNWKDKGEQVFTKNGFRSRWPCLDCKDRPLRIFSMGGSSTFGIPMYHTQTAYPTVLERLLKERNPESNIEVFNAGIPGFGIFQVLDSINRTILPYKPDIVTINVSFNDTGPAPGWYEGLGNSDQAGYFQMRFLRWLQEWWPYSQIHNTRTFAWARHALVQTKLSLLRQFPGAPGEVKKSANSKVRSTPEEFREGLRRIVVLAHKHNFLPVLIPEPVNHTPNLQDSIKTNRYHAEMVEIAREEDVPLVDILTPLNSYGDNWLFYDIVHTNEAAHRVVAESIYRDLFNSNGQTKWGKNFFSSHGLSFESAPVRRNPMFQIERDSALKNQICVELKAPFKGGNEIQTRFILDGKELLQLEDLNEQFQTIRIPLPTNKTFYPLIDLQISSGLKTNKLESDKFSLADAMPFYVELHSGVNQFIWKTEMKLRGMKVGASAKGYTLALVENQSGLIKQLATFDPEKSSSEAAKLYQFLEEAGKITGDEKAPILFLTLRGEGTAGIDLDRLKELLRKFGGENLAPKKDRAFIFIGRAGAPPGSAIVKSENEQESFIHGDPSWSSSELLEVRAAKPCEAI